MYSFTLYVLTLQKNSDHKQGAPYTLHLPLYSFCIDMPEDGLNTGKNMDSTHVTVITGFKINLCCVKLNKCSLFMS